MKVGEAFVEIRPNVDGFEAEANQKLGSTFKNIAKGAVAAFAAVKVKDFLGGAVAEAQEAAKATAQTEAVIRSTGAAAKVTAGDVSELAEALSRKAGIDDEAIQAGENLLLTFTKIRNETGKGNDIFNQASEAALDMSVAMGTDMKGAAILVGKALNDPIKGVTALTRSGVQFTEQQKEQIRTLVESGDTLGAQKIILGELNTQFAGSAEAQATAADKMKVGWANLQETLGSALMPVVNDVIEAFTEFLPVIEPLLPILVPLAAAITAIVVATKIWTAVQTAMNVVLAANPIGLIVIALAALVAGLVYAYQHSETFRDIVNGVLNGLATAFDRFKNVAVGALQGIVTTFLTTVETIIRAAATAFGWVPGLGPKLREAADKVGAFRDTVNEALGNIKDKHVRVTAEFVGGQPGVYTSYNGRMPGDGKVRQGKASAAGNWLDRGELSWVGERGPELFLSTGGRVLSHQDSMRAISESGWAPAEPSNVNQPPIHVQVVMPDGRVLAEAVYDPLRRMNNGTG